MDTPLTEEELARLQFPPHCPECGADEEEVVSLDYADHYMTTIHAPDCARARLVAEVWRLRAEKESNA